MARLKIAVLISGRGSNLKALLTACANPEFPAEIVAVASDNEDAGGLSHAEAFNVPCVVVARRDHLSKAAFETALDTAVRSSGADLVCLAGFMRLLSPEFLSGWDDKIINIHPSLLPSFRGLNTHERALAAGVRISGCTVHVVRPAMDEGPILVQAAVPVMTDDTEDDLAGRILAAEHKAYPLAVRLLAENRLRVDGDRVVTSERSRSNSEPTMIVPSE